MWKTGSDALYVDLISETVPLREDKTISTLNKSDAISIEKRNKGIALFKDKKMFESMELFNESLCFAEEGSVNISEAYFNRAFCFLKLEYFDECFADIELAKESNYPDPVKLEQRKKICMTYLKNTMDKTGTIASPGDRYKAKLCTDPNEKFPCLANIINIERSGGGSNGDDEIVIVAKEDIAVNQCIAIEEPFSVSLHRRFGWKCCICLKSSVNLVPCKNCTVAMFCTDEKCRDSFLHKYECGKIVDCEYREQMEQLRGILIAINAFSSADELMDFVEKTMESHCNEVPDNLTDTRSKYRIFLKFTFDSDLCESKDFFAQYVHPIYKFLMDIPSIAEFFNSLKHQRFLMHLIAHHVLIGQRHTRIVRQQNLSAIAMEMDTQYSSTGLLQKYFKHSCAPNVQMISFENKSIFLTLLPVKQGQLLHQSLFPFLHQSRQVRQGTLLEHKGIVCKCIRCKGTYQSYFTLRKIAQDENYCYIKTYGSVPSQLITNYEELYKRCVAFLTSFGQETWCNEIAEVTTVFIALKRIEIQGFTLLTRDN